MKSSRQPVDSERPDSSVVPRLTSIPRHLEEWLDNFFDGSPTVRFTCTPRFYDRMYFRLREAADSHGYDPDLIVGLGGALEFRRRQPQEDQQPTNAQEPVSEDARSPGEDDEPETAPELTPAEYLARAELLRDEIARDSEQRRRIACFAVASGIQKSRVFSNAGVTAPTLDRWLQDYRPDDTESGPKRLLLRRLQILNTQIRSNTSDLRVLATEATIVTGNVSQVAKATGLSRQAIYRWLKIHHAANN